MMGYVSCKWSSCWHAISFRRHTGINKHTSPFAIKLHFGKTTKMQQKLYNITYSPNSRKPPKFIQTMTAPYNAYYLTQSTDHVCLRFQCSWNIHAQKPIASKSDKQWTAIIKCFMQLTLLQHDPHKYDTILQTTKHAQYYVTADFILANWRTVTARLPMSFHNYTHTPV